MWIEIEVLLRDKMINWKELGFDIKHEFTRRMVRADEIYYLQELVHDIQILTFNDTTSVYIKGSYETLRNQILHLTAEQDDDDDLHL